MSGEAPRPAAGVDELTLVSQLLRRALRFWRLGAAVGVVAAALALAGVVLWPRTYTSQATLLYHEGLHLAQEEASNPRRIGQRLSELLLSRVELASVVDELKLYPKLVAMGKKRDAVEEMRLATKLRYDQGDVFVVSFTGASPQEAQRVTARLSELLISEHQRLRSGQAELTREFLDSEKKRKTQELSDRQSALVTFLSRHPEFSADQSTGVGVGIRARRERANEPVMVVGGGPAPTEPTPGVEPLIVARNAAEAKLAAVKRELADKRSRFTDQHPEVRAALAAVESAQQAFDRAAEEARSVAPPPPPRPRGGDAPRIVRRGGDGVSAARAVALETEWARLTREVAEAREQLQLLETQQFRASMAATMLVTGQTSQLTVIDPAFLPTRPNGVRSRILFAVALLLAAFAGIVAAVIRAWVDDVIYVPADVERRSEIPVLAVVSAGPGARGAGGGQARSEAPQRLLTAGGGASGDGAAPGSTSTALARVQPTFSFAGKELHGIVRVHRIELTAGIDPRVVMLAAPDSPAAATFRQLRHRLEAGRRTRTVLVTSPRAGEGKTTTAVNVALALGEGGRARVLLVEANFRAPSLAQLFGFEPPACVSEQLQRHREDPTAPWEVVESIVPWLHLLAVSPHNTGQPMLDALLLSVCIDWLRNAGYDFVVVDCPGVLEGADVNMVEESVDGILMVLRAGTSRAAELRNAAGQVDSAKILGTVLVGD